MIPKIIHYCWFGRGKKSDLILKCIESWKKYCPDYEIKEWNEDNFDINCCQYVKEAYEHKKWAFVSDYARLYVLYNYGGVYLDTDTELIKNIDSLLNYSAYAIFENKNIIGLGLIGSSANNKWVLECLNNYNNINFLNTNGTINIVTITKLISKLTEEKYNLKLSGKKIEIDNLLTVLPEDYLNSILGENKKTENTVAIHHCDASWIDGNKKIIKFKLKYSKQLNFIRKVLYKTIGEKNFNKLKK